MERQLHSDIFHCSFMIEIKVYKKNSFLHHVGFAVIIDKKWKYTLDFQPKESWNFLFGSQSEVCINEAPDKSMSVTLGGLQYKYTSHEYNWKNLAWKRIEYLLKPNSDVYRILTTNCSNEVKSKLNTRDRRGALILKEAEEKQLSLKIAAATFISAGVLMAAGLSRQPRKSKQHNRNLNTYHHI